MAATTELGKAIVEQISIGRVDDDLTSIAWSMVERGQQIGRPIETADVLARLIADGKYDGGLSTIQIAVTERLLAQGHTPPAHPAAQATEPTTRAPRVGDTIRVTARLRPNYLLGRTFTVKRFAPKRGGGMYVVVSVPDDPQFRKFAGNSNLKIPADAVEVVA